MASFLNNSEKSTILVTGGGTGIGLNIAKRLLALGHVVIVSGRRQERLDQAAEQNPGLKTIRGDVSSDAERVTLFNKVVKEYPDVNVLINNAGIANFDVPLLKDTTAKDWEGHKDIWYTNVFGTIHLSILFLPHLLTKPNALIANVTSIVGFFPVASESSYSATKAALHSFTQSLRQQTKGTSVKVVEIIPPAVATESVEGRGFNGIDVEVYGKDTVAKLLLGELEIGFEGSETIIRGTRDQLDGHFNAWNGNNV